MRNKITDLNNHLFAQLERLGDEDLTNEDLQKEIERSKAMTSIASQLVESARVSVEAMKVAERAGADPTRFAGSLFQPNRQLTAGHESDEDHQNEY